MDSSEVEGHGRAPLHGAHGGQPRSHELSVTRASFRPDPAESVSSCKCRFSVRFRITFAPNAA
eukprot:384636-Lingulodinium_polyedra.AAC.1